MTNLESVKNKMKKLYCVKCGCEVNLKLGMIPKKCSCGVKFDETDIKKHKNIIGIIIIFIFLMSPPFILVYFSRQAFQNSIILYMCALVMIIVWYRIVETVLIRIGLITMTNIEIRKS